jgi:hypothetical protein
LVLVFDLTIETILIRGGFRKKYRKGSGSRFSDRAHELVTKGLSTIHHSRDASKSLVSSQRPFSVVQEPSGKTL